MTYSVLMSVYHKEKADNLRAAMQSIWAQTIPTDDFVLVCDGPLTAELDAVIEEMQREHEELKVVRLQKNVGLGNALNEGIGHCKNELVARMDSDDISRPDRCERQIGVFSIRPDVDICSGIVEEFIESTDHIESKRIVPETHEEILSFAKMRNPFNHPCVMYKRSKVEEAGGYLDMYLLEDYYLWIRMLQHGSDGYNLQEPLLWMRAGPGLYRRRSGWKYAKSQKTLFEYMKDTQFIGGRQYITAMFVRTAAAMLPNGLREFLYKRIMRKDIG